MRKGITPIIATIVLLLIAIAIAGAAYTYITGYAGGLTNKILEVQSASCGSAGVTINVRNSGTANVSLTDGGADVSVIKEVNNGNAAATKSLTYTGVSGATNALTPGAGGTITDAFCNSTLNGGSTCRYTVVASGRPSTPVPVTC